MPEVTDSTPRTEITVAGQTFKAPQPYTAGHVLNANEASALNQTYAENLRNNFAGKVKEAQEAGTFDLEVFQGRFDDYAGEYEFGVRTGGGRSGDPVTAEAMGITRDLVRKALQKAGHKLADVPAAKISELAKAQLAKTDDPKTVQIMDLARSRVAAAQEITDIEIGSVEEGDTAEAPKGRKARAEAEA
jgi:hypothetical protein